MKRISPFQSLPFERRRCTVPVLRLHCRPSQPHNNDLYSLAHSTRRSASNLKVPPQARGNATTPMEKPYENPGVDRSSLPAPKVLGALFFAVAIGIGGLLYINGREKKTKIFDLPRFMPFNIVSREEVSPTSILLTLRPHAFITNPNITDSDPYAEQWDNGTWSVEIKQPELQIARRYTPLPPTPSSTSDKPTTKTPKIETGDLRFLIRKEHKGELSTYIHGMKVGSDLQLRGPYTEYTLPPTLETVVFLAAGTGIAPALQVAHTLLSRNQTTKITLDPLTDNTATSDAQAKIHIVWCNRRREDCQGGGENGLGLEGEKGKSKGRMVEEIEALQKAHPGQLTVDYLVDDEKTYLDQKRLSRLLTTVTSPQQRQNIPQRQTTPSTLTSTPATSTNPDTAHKLILLSGPEGFITHFAGPKKWEGGKEGQGALGGVLGQLGMGTRDDWMVWKL